MCDTMRMGYNGFAQLSVEKKTSCMYW